MKNGLGQQGTDIITGFTGTIMGYVEYFTGCNQYLLVPKCKAGEENVKQPGEWFDDSRIKVEPVVPIKLIKGKADGPGLAPPLK